MENSQNTGLVRAAVKVLRPHQWVKNLFVLAPAIFAQDFFGQATLLKTALATVLFCLVSGAVYIFNDICDVEADKNHPLKRHRPIARGDLSVPIARLEMIGILVLSFGLGGLVLGVDFVAVAVGYFALNTLYSFRLKQIAYLDVLSIALGFVLRVVAGGVAIDVPVSRWLLLCTFLLALFLGLGKRLHELLSSPDASGRKSLSGYRGGSLVTMLRIIALLTALAYVGYTLDPATTNRFNTHWLVATSPCILFGLYRFQSLVLADEDPASPTERMIRDPSFILNLAVWGCAIFGILYTV
mgnify:CR=1 FL=1|tara:strand:- start:756 stop:1649 length:894 start_codon:yes stop_codon:yes gene_type:complete